MSGGARDGAALEETGARLGDVLRRALRDRLARRRDGVSTDADDWPAEGQPVDLLSSDGWSSHGRSFEGQGVGERAGGDAGQARSTNMRDSTGGTGQAALPLPGGARPARDRGERT